MAFTRRSRPVARQGGVARLWGVARALAMVGARLLTSVIALAIIAACIVYLRLLQGPIAMPGMARMLAEQVNQASDRVQIDVGDVVLTLGEGAATSGLQFRAVEVRAPDGQRLLSAPRVAARFHLADLLHGRLQPVRITLIEPDAQIIRAEDGRVRFGLGDGAGVALRRSREAGADGGGDGGGDGLARAGGAAVGGAGGPGGAVGDGSADRDPDADAGGDADGDAAGDADGDAAGDADVDAGGDAVEGRPESAGLAALGRLIDGVVGDQPPAPELAKLERIEILGANLTFDDRRGGGRWSTETADLRLWRYPGGARAAVELVPGDLPGTAVSIVADRPAGAGRTELAMHFRGLKAERLAGQVAALDWLRLVGGTVAGEATATLERDGTLSALDGVIFARDGVIRGMGAPLPFEEVDLRFRADPVGDRLAVERLRLRAPSLSAELAGHAEIDRDDTGAVRGLAGQVEIGALHIDMPERFAAPLDFDGGRLTARWSLPGRTVELTDSLLVRGEMAVALDGVVRQGTPRAGPGGWLVDMRAGVTGMTADDLVALWPVTAAENARRWIDGHVVAGDIDRATAQLRLGGDAPQVAVAFEYSGLSIDYLDGMTPLVEARGTGHVSLHDLFMQMEEGRGTPLEGRPIDLAGSSLAIRSFWGDVSPAEVSIRGRGPVDSILALIDQPPLRLTRKLGRPLDVSSGSARVTAELSIPLLKDVRIADISVGARATISDLALPFQIAPGRSVGIRAERIELVADTSSLHLEGAALIEGAPVAIDWNEAYGPGQSGRTIGLAGTATPALLAGVGAAGLPIEGAPAFELELRQAGGGALAFALDADLEAAGVDIPGLDWSKPPGVPGRLLAEGTEGGEGGGLDIAAMTLTGPGLDAQGALRLDAGGGLVRGSFPRLRLADRGTFAATLRRAPDGVLEVGLTGQRLDLSDRIEGAGETRTGAAGGPGDDGPSTPVRLSLNVDRLQLGKRILLAPASGAIEQHASGAVAGQIQGRLGAAPVVLTLDLPAQGTGAVRLTSPDAGAVLRAADLYSDAQGGTLVLDAQVGQPDGTALAGHARIEDVRVRSKSTFRTMLREGGLNSAEQEVATGGIGFRKVTIPFSYDGGQLRVKDAIAVSPALGLKVNGTVDERTDEVDMVGVLSPAYGLTGALNEVPLLGEILGGEGEGVLAMTFRLSGPTANPRFTVNPLSMLAPGFLRKIFTAPTSDVSEDFRESLTPQNR